MRYLRCGSGAQRAFMVGIISLVTIAFTACSSPLAGQSPSIASLHERSGNTEAAASSARLFVGEQRGTIYGYDVRGRLVRTIRLPGGGDVETIAFDSKGNMYADVRSKQSSTLEKYAPPYNRAPIYQITETCLGRTYVSSTVLYEQSCDEYGYAAYNALDGSPIGSVKILHSIVRTGGSDNGGADSYGNFFTFAVNKGTASVVEYVPPSTLHDVAFSHAPFPVLFTDGATTLYAGARNGLNVYRSVGLGVAPQYKYSIKEPHGIGSEGQYAAAGNGVLFAAPFQKVRTCGILHTSWTISVFRPGSAMPFERIHPAQSSNCLNGGVLLMIADNAGDLFVLNQGFLLSYYSFGSTVPAWSKQLRSASLAVI
jgi:hypothetical protein